MVELVQLEKRQQDFAKRHVRVVVISNDNQETARATQADVPHLVVVADTEQKMARAIEVIHPGAGQHHDDTNAPTTFLVDGTGTVCWSFRPDSVIVRLSPDEVLAAVDKTWKGE